MIAFFELTDISTKAKGYETAVHFRSAAGLRAGAIVLESGVSVGSVEAIKLLDDYTVDVIMLVKSQVDIPRRSRFLIQAPLTGDPILVIVPPTPPNRAPGVATETPAPNAVATLPHKVLPVEEQPQGDEPVSVADLLVQGQGEMAQLDKVMNDFTRKEPALLNAIQSAISNANDLTIIANQSVQQLSRKANTIADSLSISMNSAANNVVDLTSALDKTVQANAGNIDAIAASLNRTSQSIELSARSLKDLASNQDVKHNLLSTTKSIAEAAQTIADLTVDLRQVTGNPQTQTQLRDAAAQADAAVQRVNSLLASFGGTSSVYGVDPGATPGPISSAPVPPGRAAPGAGAAAPNGTKRGNPSSVQGNFKNKIGQLAKNLVGVQIRLSSLNKQRAYRGAGTPLLGQDRGPQSDVNLIILPSGRTSAFAGVNDLGAKSSYNFAAMQSFGDHIRVGGGVLYSRLGVLGEYNNAAFGLEGRLYDLRHPTLDGYARLKLHPGIAVFGGQRDILHDSRRNVFGLELRF